MKTMAGRGLTVGVLAVSLAAAQRFELRGRIEPAPKSAAVTLDGARTPFTARTAADSNGRFRFGGLAPGSYTLSVVVPGQGATRQTVEIGPSLADSRGRVRVTVAFRPQQGTAAELAERKHKVSLPELRIPERAIREYRQAQEKLSRNEVDAAIRHLQRAVELAPQFSAAWNHLGTIAYHARRYEDAERYFREALAQEPGAFSPLVNLGGVLLNLRRFREALDYNLEAVRERPNDALAQSQLGMNYYFLGNDEKALEHLTRAKQLDPAHFSHPQLILAEIRLRRADRTGALRELEDFLARHPDAPEGIEVRARLQALAKP